MIALHCLVSCCQIVQVQTVQHPGPRVLIHVCTALLITTVNGNYELYHSSLLMTYLPAVTLELFAQRTALQHPCVASEQAYIVYFKHLMQRALALQTYVKLELYIARVVILLLALTSLLSCASSEPARASDAYQLNASFVPSNREAGWSTTVAGAPGSPAPDGSQLPPPRNRVESSPEIKFRGADHAAPPVCQTTDIFHVLHLPPAADCCPAEGIVDASAQGGH